MNEHERQIPRPDRGPRWNRFSVWLAVSGYWLAIYLSSRIQSLVGAGDGDGVPVVAAVYFCIIIVCMATERGGWTVLKRAAFVPASLAAHAFLTLPAAAALGILMYDPDRVRSIAEQRAVFILASLPVLAYAMWRSRLFVTSGDDTIRHSEPRPTEPSQ